MRAALPKAFATNWLTSAAVPMEKSNARGLPTLPKAVHKSALRPNRQRITQRRSMMLSKSRFVVSSIACRLSTWSHFSATVPTFRLCSIQRRVQHENIDPYTPVTVGVRDVRLESVLDLMLKPMNLDFKVRDEILLITDRVEELVTKVYPVEDIVLPGSGLKAGQFAAERSCCEYRSDLSQDLIESIEDAVCRGSWIDQGGESSIEYFQPNCSLVITATPQSHDEVTRLLCALRKMQTRSAEFVAAQSKAAKARRPAPAKYSLSVQISFSADEDPIEAREPHEARDVLRVGYEKRD